MGKIDDKTEDYFDNIYRFADMWNGYMYQGKEVIKVEELENTDRIVGGWYKGKKKRVISDCAKLWRGKYLRLLVLENQSYIDYRMVLRNMMQESFNYDKQWKALRDKHKEMKDLKADEYLSGMSKADKFIPVVTLVINLSGEKWDAATNLYDILDWGDDEKIKDYVNDYKINLYDYHDYENFDEFKTSLKNLFEFIRYRDNEIEIKDRLLADDRYNQLDEDTAKLIDDISKIEIEIVGGTGNMCKAFDDHMLRGKREGKIIDKIELIIKKYIKGKDLSQIADELETIPADIEKYYNLVVSNKEASADEIYAMSIGK